MALEQFIYNNPNVDHDIKKRVLRQARAERLSISRWIANAVREKLDRTYEAQMAHEEQVVA